ncbi:polysaccharide biosynthesis protein [Mesobacillus maritimus]|uniref:putative polysaccharide biosynthesis protein n=1 Tax=Mesobacillus maritimus TaxID=1643336 RepID=UPI002040586A|nr:polysaccharide biosynthesis protein [Mesobacillus maritimus]MCM3588562.1 polysaccharide biosynthesis protein [Mesobacillus maritimus]MCM3671579.1 polysaccharide biosynthesis protein [Mesobacillus maritimus]
MKPISGSQELFRGAMILTAAALITKILSAIYRVPFQNIVGDIGFYIYQQVYPFYGILLILATQGFPVVISKLYKETLALGDQSGAIRLLSISLYLLTFVALLLFCVFFFGAQWIAVIMGDEQLAGLFRVMAFPFLLFPFTSVFRGYFQGAGNMIPTAISQVGEQLVRVMTILILSYLFVRNGYSLYTAGSGAVFGSVTGGVIGFLILGTLFFRSSNGVLLHTYEFKKLRTDFWPVSKSLLVQGFAVSVSGMVLILFQLADALNLFNLLSATNLSQEEAKTAKGVFDRGQPLIQLGTVVATSIALTVVPAITGVKDKKVVIENIRIALKLSMLVGAAAAIGLVSIIEPTNIMLFKNSEGSLVLGWISLLILPGSVIITLIGILQGVNQFLYPAVIVAFGFGLKFLLNYVLVPIGGTTGAAMASIIASLAIMIVLIIRVRKTVGERLLSTSFLLKTLLASAVMAGVISIYLRLTELIVVSTLPLRLVATFQALTAVMIGALVYLVLVMKTRLLGEKELELLPMGSKLLVFMPKKTGVDKK